MNKKIYKEKEHLCVNGFIFHKWKCISWLTHDYVCKKCGLHIKLTSSSYRGRAWQVIDMTQLNLCHDKVLDLTR